MPTKTKSAINLADLDKIIKICKENRIQEIEYLGFKLRFDNDFSSPKAVPGSDETKNGPLPIREVDLSELMLTDPEGYEDFISKESNGQHTPPG